MPSIKKNMLDRSKGPIIHNDFDLTIRDVETSELSNGIRLIELNSGSQDIVKVELILDCGRIHESKIAAAKAALKLIREGTTSKNSNDLAYIFDYYGASVKISTGLEVSSISIVCLSKFFDRLWDVWMDMIMNPIFREEEIEKYKSIESQKMRNQLAKNEIISYRIITEKVFGSDHPYGYNTRPDDILSLTRDHIKEYYEKQCHYDNAILVLSGKYNKSIRSRIIESISQLSKPTNQSKPTFFDHENLEKSIVEVTENDLQSSIKLGKPLFKRSHPDYSAFNFTNTILGGYFGSRLMTNIREEKGYTYGIYSLIDTWRHGGFFYISADVGSDLIDPTMKEVWHEIDVLKNELVPEEEIDMVKNYILGQSLNLMDGPFATAQLVKSLYIKKLSINDFENHIKTMKNMTSQDIIDMANKYLHKETFTSVIVGGYKA